MKRSIGWAFLAVVGLAVGSAVAADATGTWKWSFATQNGETRETTLKLKQEEGKLTGTISGRENTENPITEGKVEGDEVSFQVKREFNGNSFVIKYKGKLEGDTIKGTMEFEREGETRSREWEAKRAS